MRKSQYELDREANIAKNKALFEELGLKQALNDLGPSKAKTTAKPVQHKKVKRERSAEPQPRRQSRRLLSKAKGDVEETPQERALREKEREQELRDQEDALERARIAKRPRHDILHFNTLAETDSPQDISELSTTMQSVVQEIRRIGNPDDFVYSEEAKHVAAVKELREKVQNLKVVSRAKVTTNRVYCAVYHPEITKDLIFFGDKHGQLGIWDARAAPEEEEVDGDIAPENKEGGKYWRLQLHWPATPKSSISSIKVDPIDSHNIYTSSYDCSIRSLSFVSGTSKEIYSTEDNNIICSFDQPATGQEMWISDGSGGVSHLDLREDKTHVRRYELSEVKIGSVSVNPTRPHFLLTASNSRVIKIWDTRKLSEMPIRLLDHAAQKSAKDTFARHTIDFDGSVINEYSQSGAGKGLFRGEWKHHKSASSAYWDPRGRQIVSTSYDDTIRIWDLRSQVFASDEPFPSLRPFFQMKHNCQTGKWLTILRAQWSPNPDTYPHFTVANMNHSLDIYSSKGDLITSLSDPTMISAVQAVTCSHPHIIERAASGNASGRCVLWAPQSDTNSHVSD
ncbi:WD40 repeat-like protein [Pholiota conissans]|uniref:DNA damage-binding protein CMR1 n=1 Tax=Pholiota conissans TaxID=109636 RepID=A0A9P5ZAC0_9AGAR|nr:WD40 repeat-like protein [Pholiota conissans]